MKPEKHISLSTHTLNGNDFDVLVHKGKISYIFQIGNERYGNAVKPKTRSTRDVVDASLNLLINYLETYEAATKKQ